jgi:NodT family efflux transporter outer membrane factor (OMF) lipoprotein
VRWWALFRTPLLSHYIRLALRTNPDLAAARATRARADALVDVAAAGLFPQVTAEATAARARALRAGANGGRAYRIPGDLYSLVLGAIRIRYRPDLFGQATDQVRSAKARRTVSAAWLRMTEVFLEASVARAVIQAADTEEQCRAAQRIATDDQSLLDLLRAEYRLGASDLEEVRQQQALTARAKAAVPPLRAQLAASRHALADLLGEYPNQTLRLPTLAAMRLPARLPTAIPSALLEQRPDIIAARAEIQAARANVDLAAANRFPQLQITAAFGKAAQSGNLFFNPLSTLWSLGAGVLAPIYDGGALAARERAAVAQYRIAGDRYRATVLEAFEQVADALRALHSDERTYEESRIAESAATQALRLAHGRYRDGSIAYSSVLDAEIAAQRDTQAAIEANSRRYLDAVALFLALGEGWSEAQGGANGGARS